MKKISKENYFELAQFLMDYHGGQWSRGYRLLCKLRVSGNWAPRFARELQNSEIYLYLEANYAGKV